MSEEQDMWGVLISTGRAGTTPEHLPGGREALLVIRLGMEAGTGRWGRQGAGRDAGRRVSLSKRGEGLLRAYGSLPRTSADFFYCSASLPIDRSRPRVDSRSPSGAEATGRSTAGFLPPPRAPSSAPYMWNK